MKTIHEKQYRSIARRHPCCARCDEGYRRKTLINRITRHRVKNLMRSFEYDASKLPRDFPKPNQTDIIRKGF